jgi:hypothetical protein
MRFAALPLLLLLGACAPSASDGAGAIATGTRDSIAAAARDSLSRARQDSINRAQPGYIVDSILPVEEEVRRFRAAVGGEPAARLQHGATSRAQLLELFAAAVASRDTVALHRLAVSPREFIDLIYPESPYTKPPYRQAPGLVWSQMQLPSESGLRRLLERHGGRAFRVARLACAVPPEVQGANRLHAKCTVRFASGEEALREGQLFGTIIERQGRFKFVSYANMY